VRAVIDTNVLISGLLWNRTPHLLLDQTSHGAHRLVSSPALIAELADVLNRSKFPAILEISDTNAERVLAQMRHLAEIFDPIPLAAPVCRDPGDDAVLALALAAQVDFIVSGDQDLLTLGAYAGIPIATPAQALGRIGVAES